MWSPAAAVDGIRSTAKHPSRARTAQKNGTPKGCRYAGLRDPCCSGVSLSGPPPDDDIAPRCLVGARAVFRCARSVRCCCCCMAVSQGFVQSRLGRDGHIVFRGRHSKAGGLLDRHERTCATHGPLPAVGIGKSLNACLGHMVQLVKGLFVRAGRNLRAQMIIVCNRASGQVIFL